ncbi:hypothetical protein G1E_33280 [Pseudomonas sp. TJI-51]|nr:hypothetical protein G1E_33280 [Pseudomonas sp. TJI-51]
MASHAVGNHTPDLQLFTLQQIPGWIARILGLKDYLTAVPGQALAKGFAVHGSDNDVAWLSLDGAIHNHEVARVDAGTDHRVALYTHQINVRSPDVEQLIKRNPLFQVIRCRRRKTCRDMEGKQREFRTA